LYHYYFNYFSLYHWPKIDKIYLQIIIISPIILYYILLYALFYIMTLLFLTHYNKLWYCYITLYQFYRFYQLYHLSYIFRQLSLTMIMSIAILSPDGDEMQPPHSQTPPASILMCTEHFWMIRYMNMSFSDHKYVYCVDISIKHIIIIISIMNIISLVILSPFLRPYNMINFKTFQYETF
jgi:hypothetical protein